MATPGPKPEKTAKLEAIGITTICGRIAEAEFLSDIAKDAGVSISTLSNWLNSDDNYKMYVRARESQADKHAEDILRIADDGLNDTQTDDDGNVIVNHDHIARSRLRVDSRKWLAAKMAPRRYGEKLELAGDKENPIRHEFAWKQDAS
jgi:transcriptional regulator with XRE-family HTH domain